MNSIRIALVIALSLTLGLTESAFAGAPGSGGRIDELEAVCKGGASSGLRCAGSADCPGGRCQIRTVGARRRPLQFTVTVIVDDQTGEWNKDEEVNDIHTVSILLEFIAQGRRRLLAQNYMNVKGEDADALLEAMRQGVEIADLPNSDRRLDEALAIAAVRDGGILDDFLFQRPDCQMEEALQHYYRTNGNFVVVKTRRVRGASDQVDNPLASVVQARLDVIVTPAED